MSGGGQDRSPVALAETLTTRAEDAPREKALLPVEPGRYEIHNELARGGLGRILLAHDRRLGRTVALKEALQSDDARLVREALVTARLSHPSIVAVHDAGRWPDGEPFFSMTRLAGRSLRAVIDERRTMRERLALLSSVIAVADAVAYAHSQGIIHRDLKPANVIIGDFGETVVIDWGLARNVREDEPAAATVSAPTGDLPAGLTRTGEVLGTPAYMAPEQVRGELSDERTDVYALGGLLYHVLTGSPPHVGDRLAVVPLLGRQPDAPPELAAIAAKALAAERADRYAGAGEFAEELKRFQTGRLVAAHRYSLPSLVWRWLRRRALPAAGVAALVAVAAGVGLTWRWQERRRLCAGGERLLAGIWDEAARGRVAAAFRRTGAPFAESAWRAVDADLSRYAGSWVDMQHGSCEASRRGEQSPAALDLRAACLDRRRDDLRALAEVLGQADTDVVARSLAAAGALPRLEGCADLEALAAPLPPPAEPRRRVLVADLRSILARAKALGDAARWRDALALALPARTAAVALGYGPLVAEARYREAVVLAGLGKGKDAEAGYVETTLAAMAARHREVEADAWIDLVYRVGVTGARYDEALADARFAEAAIARLGGDDVRTARLLGNIGLVRNQRGDLRGALAEHQRALALGERVLAADDPLLADMHFAAGTDHTLLGQYPEAERHLGEALELHRRASGPAHPSTATVLNALGNVAVLRGDNATARQRYEQALAITEAALGLEHPSLAKILSNLGNLEQHEHRGEAARALLERSLRISEKSLGPEHPKLASALNNLGNVLGDLGRHAEALAAYRRAQAILEKSEGPDGPGVAQVLYNLAMELHDCDEELTVYRRSLAAVEKSLGPDHPEAANALLGIAECAIKGRRFADAVAPLERALAIRLTSGNERLIAEVRFALGRALFGVGHDRTRALALIEQAHIYYAVAPGSDVKLGEIARWRAQNRVARP